eukprot:m.103183 g.103183  ORF g.103183 m.103183 type:complete len:72 (-) comp13231_c0_seq2:441-656(-)
MLITENSFVFFPVLLGFHGMDEAYRTLLLSMVGCDEGREHESQQSVSHRDQRHHPRGTAFEQPFSSTHHLM